MANLIHIGEVAALLFVAYQLAWFVGFVLRRASTRPVKSVAAPSEPTAVRSAAEPPIRTPVIEPIATVPVAPSAGAAAVEALLARVDPPSTTLLPELPPPASAGAMDVTPPAMPVAADADVAPPPVPTAPEADVSPPVPLNEEFLAELQSAMLAQDPPEEPAPADPRAAAALTAAFEEAFELTPVSESELVAPPADTAPEPEPVTPSEDEPGLFDLPASEPESIAPVASEPPETAPDPPVAAPPSPIPVASESPQPVEEPLPLPSAGSLAKDAMPVAPMAPATQPATVATNARPRPAPPPIVEIVPPPEPEPATPTADASPPVLKPASKPGEVWSGRAGKPPAERAQRPAGILRPAGAPRAPSPGFPAARPATPSQAPRPAGEIAATARDAVAAAAAKVKEVVAAAADYDDGMEASDEDAEAAAMRAIESGWMRKATPRTTKPERPEGVPPTKPKAR